MATQDAKNIINGRQYYVVQMPPVDAVVLQLEISRILGTAIGALIPALGKNANSNDSQRAAALGGVFGMLFEKASPAELTDLIVRVVSTAKVDGRRIDVNNDFQGEYLPDLYKVFMWVLQVNFASFFGAGGLDGLLGKFKVLFKQEMAAQLQPKTPPQTSTPTSGEQ